MSSLAKYLLYCGKTVAGYDRESSEYTLELEKSGVKIAIGNEIDSVKDFEVVIYTDAVGDGDKRLKEARRLEKYVISRGQFLYEVSRCFNCVIAVSGCHGKTTCVSMLAHIFNAAKRKFAAHIGGRDLAFKNFCAYGNEYFITEACEYKKNFLLLKPDVAVILNSEPDHLECYGNAERLKEAYLQFAASAQITVGLYKDLPVTHGVTFGFDGAADYSAKRIKCVDGEYLFTVCEGGRELGEIKLKVAGKHNVLNALAAIAVARCQGISFESTATGLAEFCGVERRFEKIGLYNGADCIADYAHHPDEIRAAIRTARKLNQNGKVFVVFQPHTYSRTKNLFKRFVKVFSQVNNLFIYKTFAAREYFDDAGSAYTLSESIKKSRYGENTRDIYDFIGAAGKGDTVLFLGAGDIYFIAKSIIEKNV